MKTFPSLLAIALLLSACTATQDYPGKQVYYSGDQVKNVAPERPTYKPQPASYAASAEFEDVCVGQWCRCESE